MSILQYNEIREKKFIILDGEPYEVLSSHVFRKQQRKPVNATKLKHLITGSVKEHSFHVSDKAAEADLEKRELRFVYHNKGEYVFSEPNDKSKRFPLNENVIGENNAKYLKSDMLVEVLVFNADIIGVKLPIKMDLKVIETPPNVRGDTATGGNKPATLETGAVVLVPLFVNEGDIISVNTETNEYTGRTG